MDDISAGGLDPDHLVGGHHQGVIDTEPGSAAGLQMTVSDIEAARAELAGRGVEVSPVQTMDPRDGGKFAFFADPDGNNWALQEVREYVGAELRS